MHSRNVQKMSEIVNNDKNLVSKAAEYVNQENSMKNNKYRRSCTPQNKISKIPRKKPLIKPDSFLPKYEESRIYPV